MAKNQPGAPSAASFETPDSPPFWLPIFDDIPPVLASFRFGLHYGLLRGLS
jgi:hypothetical protein